LKVGLVQIYTGDGKGKTTAAMGLAVRALAAGLRVLFCQFMKGSESGEFRLIKKLSNNIDTFLCGLNRFCTNKENPAEDQIKAAKLGLEISKKAILAGKYDIVILDEINVALYFNLIKLDDILEIIKNKPSSVEIILTGRNAPPELYEFADLVSEIKEIKHYFQKGINARKGIEY